MEKTSLTALADEQLAVARQAPAGRAAHTIHGGHDHVLRQTVIALVAGRELAEHESPGEATLQVLRGHVRLTAGEETWDGGTGDHVTIPPIRHALAAVDDSAVLLTAVGDVLPSMSFEDAGLIVVPLAGPSPALMPEGELVVQGVA